MKTVYLPADGRLPIPVITVPDVAQNQRFTTEHRRRQIRQEKRER